MFIYTIYMESNSDLLFTLLLSLMSYLWVPFLASQTPVLITFYYKITCYWSINKARLTNIIKSLEERTSKERKFLPKWLHPESSPHDNAFQLRNCFHHQSQKKCGKKPEKYVNFQKNTLFCILQRLLKQSW